jgi:HSP20 family protein
MTLYIQPYSFGFAQDRPFRRIARRWMSPSESAVRAHSLGVNVREEDDTYVLSALVPGLKAEDLNIQALEDVIRIEGEYKTEEAEYLLNELPSGSFTRTLRLPAPIEADQIEAKIADGVLTLRVPKAESARPRRINISMN